MTLLSDEILIAYGDGELGPDQVRAVEEVFASDQYTLDNFKRLQRGRERLIRAFASMNRAEANEMAAQMAGHMASRIAARPAPNQDQEQSASIPVNKAEKGPSLLVPAVAFAVLILVGGVTIGYFAGRSPDNAENSGFETGFGNFWNEKLIKEEEERAKAQLNKKQVPLKGAPPTKTGSLANAPSSTLAPKAATLHRQKWFETLAGRHKSDLSGLLGRFKGKIRNTEAALFSLSAGDIAPALIPELSEDSLQFVGADKVKNGSEMFVRLVYRDVANGAVPVVLYVAANKGGSLTLERGYLERHNYVHWTQSKRSYLLIGAVPHWRLIVLSVAVQRQLVN